MRIALFDLAEFFGPFGEGNPEKWRCSDSFGGLPFSVDFDGDRTDVSGIGLDTKAGTLAGFPEPTQCVAGIVVRKKLDPLWGEVEDE